MKTPVVHAVIFDFDGVLADTERLHLQAIQQVLTDRGWALSEADYLTHYLGYDDRGVFTAFVQSIGASLSDAAMRTLLNDKADAYARRLAAGQVLFPTAAACIERLGDVFPLAVASGSLRGEIEHILVANNLRNRFDAIIGADDVVAGKPAPESYLSAARALGIEPGQALAIEDSPWGLQSARAAGLVAVGVTTSYPHTALTDAHHVISSLDDMTVPVVRALIASLGRDASASAD